MDVELSRQELMLLQQILDGSVADMGLRIRHTRGLDAKDDLKRRRALLRRLKEKLVGSTATSENAYGVIVASLQ